MQPQTLYDAVGGTPVITRLVDRFYDHMATDEHAADIRSMHEDLKVSRHRLTLFLTMWMGGPRTYIEKRGHPRMRARHMPFPIGRADAVAWLTCMKAALKEEIDDVALQNQLLSAFAGIADHMRNQPEG
ncbi:MAG: hypothetical protein GWP91_25215 [Rhodobacterales bacterium]|nr:hypothetical protein [Rhodobacterales bacterium]